MLNKQMMQSILQLIRHANFEVAEGAVLATASWSPAQPLTESLDVRVNCEAGSLHAKHDHAGGGLDADAGEFEEFIHGFVVVSDFKDAG